MELRYAHIHDSMESATMYLKGIIGKDVDTVQFVNEIKYLEKLGIQHLDIRINSGGGSVLAGYDIVDALFTTPMNTTTFIGGMAASMAGVIAMVGKTVKIANYGLLMIHSVSGMSDEAVIAKFNQSLAAIFNSRKGIDKSYLERLMNTETFFTAEEAKASGFVDEIVVTGHIIAGDVHNTSLEELMNIYNKIDIENMEDKSEILEEAVVNEDLVVEPSGEEAPVEPETVVEATPEPAAEEEAVEEVEALVEPAEPEADAAEILRKNVELSEANEQLLKRLKELETVNNELVEKENNRLKAEKEARETAIVNEALEAGKITNEVKDTWMNFIRLDFDGAKKALDNIVMNKVSIDVMDIVNKTSTFKTPGKALRELERENPTEVERIYRETPEIYNMLYFEEYGVYPSK